MAASAGVGVASGQRTVRESRRRAAAVLRAAGPSWVTVDDQAPDRVQLRPAVDGVVDIGADDVDVIASGGRTDMTVVTRHQLDHEVSVLSGSVAGEQHR